MAERYPFTRRDFLPDRGTRSFSVWDRLKEAVKLAEWRQRRWGVGTQYIAAIDVELGGSITVRQSGTSKHHFEMSGPPAEIARIARLVQTVTG